MLSFTGGLKVFIALEPCGLRKSFNGLRALVSERLGEEAGPLTWDLVLYRSWVHHELLALNNAQGVPLGTVNADDTIHQGVEAGLEAELTHGLLIGGVRPDRRLDAKESKETRQQSKADRMVVEQTYHLSDFRFDGDRVYGDHRIAGNPMQAYKAEIRYEHPAGVYFGPNVEWNIVQYPVDEANTLFADPYALLGFRAGYRSQRICTATRHYCRARAKWVRAVPFSHLVAFPGAPIA